MKPTLLYLLSASVLLLHPACRDRPQTDQGVPGGSGADATNEAPEILTTFYPTQYFASRIAQGHAKVSCPLPPDADPIFWMPDAEAIQQYQNASLIIVNGAGFEKWIDKVTLPADRVIDTMASQSDALVHYENAITHRHGPEGEHSHEGVDGHTWVDPLLAVQQAKEIEQAMAARWPGEAPTFAENFAALEADLTGLHDRFQRWAEAWKGHTFFASHPAYNYLAKRYQLDLVNLDLDPDAIPDAETLHEMTETAAAHGIRYLLWESPPAPEVAAATAELGLENVVLSPVETRPEEGDYLTAMQANLERLEALQVSP